MDRAAKIVSTTTVRGCVCAQCALPIQPDESCVVLIVEDDTGDTVVFIHSSVCLDGFKAMSLSHAMDRLLLLPEDIKEIEATHDPDMMRAFKTKKHPYKLKCLMQSDDMPRVNMDIHAFEEDESEDKPGNGSFALRLDLDLSRRVLFKSSNHRTSKRPILLIFFFFIVIVIF
jgi:hypothetical protein